LRLACLIPTRPPKSLPGEGHLVLMACQEVDVHVAVKPKFVGCDQIRLDHYKIMSYVSPIQYLQHLV
jgi:hypothetical protein